MKLEVLVTTMHQTDFCKYKEMNLQTDAVIANQTDHESTETMFINKHRVTMVSSVTRGLSRNRNIAMAHASQQSDYIIFSDDDLVFDDDYENKIIEEFQRHQDAEAIKFNLHDLSDTRKISMKRIEKFEKATRRNMSSSGVWGVVVKTEILKKYNLHFHENFGPGTVNYCGEDTIFLMDMLDKKVKFYRSPIDIAGIDQTESSWFKGHNEQYFTTAGMVLGTIYPILSYIIVIRSAYKFSKREDTDLPFMKILKCYYRGIKHHV